MAHTPEHGSKAKSSLGTRPEKDLEQVGDLARRTFHTAGRQTTENGIFDPSIATDNCNCDCHKTRDEVDKLLDAYGDVTSPQFRAWYCKAIYAMGCQVFSDLAEQARGGKDPARYFSHLLKARLGARQ
jgi:hypothetical protein